MLKTSKIKPGHKSGPVFSCHASFRIGLRRFSSRLRLHKKPLKTAYAHKSTLAFAAAHKCTLTQQSPQKGLHGVVKGSASAASVPSARLCSSVQGLSCIRPPKKQHMSVCLIPFTPAVWPGALQRVDFLSSMPLSSLWGNASLRCQVGRKPAGCGCPEPNCHMGFGVPSKLGLPSNLHEPCGRTLSYRRSRSMGMECARPGTLA